MASQSVAGISVVESAGEGFRDIGEQGKRMAQESGQLVAACTASGEQLSQLSNALGQLYIGLAGDDEQARQLHVTAVKLSEVTAQVEAMLTAGSLQPGA